MTEECSRFWVSDNCKRPKLTGGNRPLLKVSPPANRGRSMYEIDRLVVVRL